MPKGKADRENLGSDAGAVRGGCGFAQLRAEAISSTPWGPF